MTKETLIKRLNALIRAHKREIKRLIETSDKLTAEHFTKAVKIREREIKSLKTKCNYLRSGGSVAEVLNELRMEV